MKCQHTIWMTVASIAFVLLCSQESMAQQTEAIRAEAETFGELQLLVKPGATVYVTDSTGIVTKGNIEGLSASILRLKVKSSIRDLTESDVIRISQWRRDSLKNGTLIGAGVGAGFAVLGIFSCSGICEGSAGEIIASGVVITGLGAAVGAGIDALITTKQTVYIGRTRVSLNLGSVRPILSSTRKGLSVSLSF